MAKAQKAVVTLVVTMLEGVKAKKKDIKELLEGELRGSHTDLIAEVKVRNVDID